jgi:uncharacterized protein involved in outer membrane biogenesis
MARGRAFRWLLWSGLAAAGLLAAAMLSSPLWLRPIAERQVSAVLGRPVAIGRLRLRPGNPLVLAAEDVVVGNPPGFPAGEEEPFARVPRLTVRLDTLASLRRREFAVSSIEVERPVLRVVATEDGRANHRFSSSAGPGGGAAGPPVVGTLTIADGRARVSLAALRADFEVAFATERGVEEGAAPGIVAEAKGTYADQPVEARFTGGAPLDLRDPSRPWPVELHLANGPTRASLKGTLQDPLRLRGATFGLLLAGPDIALLYPLIGVPLPATPPYELGGKLDYAERRFRFTDLAGRVGRSDVEGTMTVALRPGQRAEVTAELRSRAVDLRDVASLIGRRPGPSGTPGQTPQQHAQATRTEAEARASPRVLPQAPLNFPKLERADMHVLYRAERIQGRSMPLDDLTLRTDVVDGAVALRPLTFGVGRGRITIGASLTPEAEGAVKAQTEIRFERLDVSRLMQASGGYQGEGALNGTARLEGTGRSVADILGGADGAASLWMAGGDLSRLLVDLAGLRLGSALLSSLGGAPRTPVECFVADLTLRRGVLSTRALLLETEDAVTEGQGTMDLGRERLEVRLRTESKRLTVGVLPAPLLISGTLKEPRAAPDPAAPAGRGGLAGALAALPKIQLGTGDDPRCEGLLGRIRRGRATGSGGAPSGGGGVGGWR